MAKLKIYAKLVNIQKLDLSNGDRINEVNLYKSLSTFADVYYNGYLFLPSNNGYHFSQKHSGLSVNDYDLCFLRNSEKEFWDIFRERGPDGPKLLWTGSPYNEKIFRNADAVVAYTESWAKQLRDYENNPISGLYDKDIYVPKKILTFPQSICTRTFSSKKDHSKTREFRRKFGADFVIGHFGRLADSCYPHSLLHILPEIKKRYPKKNIKLIYSGLPAQNKVGKKNCSIKKFNPLITRFGAIDHADMPYAISACDLIASNYRVGSANWGGSRHVLEAASCGVPVLTGNFSVRKEQLGKDYPLMWPWSENNGRVSSSAEKVMFDHICRLIENPRFGASLGFELSGKMKSYSADAIGAKIKGEVDAFLRSFK